MKKITYLLFVFFLSWQVNAQLFQVATCNGTIASNVYGPMNSTTNASATNRTAVIYPASQLVGIAGQELTDVYFKRLTAAGAIGGTPNFKVYLKETTATDFGAGAIDWATEIATATLVYDADPAASAGTTAGWKNFAFSTNFTYSGTNNLAVYMEYVNTGNATTIGWEYEYSAPCINTGNNNTTKYVNNTTGTLGTSLATSNYRRPWIAFDFTVLCPAPTNLTATNVTSSSVDLSWTTGASETEWQYVIQPQGTGLPTGSGTSTTSNSFTNSTLSPATSYEVYVRSYCNVTDQSVWVGPINFTTLCAPLTVPSLEPFDTFLPNCWDEADNGDLVAGPATFGAGVWAVDGFANNGTTGAIKVLLSVAADNDWVVSPQYVIPTTGYQLKFDAAATQSGATTAPTSPWESDDFVEVLVSTTGSTNWTVLDTYNDTNVPSNMGDVNFINLDAYAGQTVRFAFRAVEGPNDGAAAIEFFVDNFEIRLTPACLEVSSLAVNNITSASADLSWLENGTATLWNIEYGVTGFTLGTGTQVLGVNTNPYSLGGLAPITTYDFYVQVDCGGLGTSVWVGPLSFTTLCAPVVAPWTYDVETAAATTNSTIDDCWDSNPTGTTAAFRWNVDDNGGTPSTATTGPSGAFSGVKYFYTEGTSGTTGAEAELYTPLVNINALATPSLQYYYHMFGSNIGELHVDIFDGTTWTNSVDVIVGQQQTAGSDPWVLKVVSLATYSGTIQVRFRAIRGAGGNCDISLDNIAFVEAPACLPPSNIVASNVTDTSVQLDWSDMSADGQFDFEYVIQPQGTGTPTGAGIQVADITVIDNSLTSVTAYEAYVRSDCGGGLFSAWVGPINFTTTCSVFTVPSLEQFTTYVPNCWEEADNGDLIAGPATFGASSWIADGFGNVGTSGSARIEIWTATLNDWIISPLYAIPATGFELKFDAAVTQWNTTAPSTNPWEADDVVEVLVSNGTTNWTVLYTYNNTNVPSTTGTPNIIDLDAYAGQNVRFAFRALEGAVNGTTDLNFYVDNFEIRPTPACPEVTTLAVANITSSSANLSWVENGTATLWNIEYGAPGFTLGTGMQQLGVTTNPYTLGGLTSNTTYEFYVQVDCGGLGTSVWVGPLSFTTSCSNFIAPWTYDVETAALTTNSTIGDCWTSNPTATTAAYRWDVDGAGSTPSTNTGPSGANSGVKYFYTEASSGTTGAIAYLTPGTVDVTALTTPYLEFYYHMYGATMGSLEVEVFDGTTWTSIWSISGQQQTATTDPWVSVGIDASAYAVADLLTFRFKATRGTDFYGDISLDDISVIEAPLCITPNASVANITVNSADLSWTTTTGNYEYVLDNNSADPVGNGTVISAQTFNATPLTPNTQYYFHVRTDCGASLYSEWTTVSFTTLPVPPANDNLCNAIPLIVDAVSTGTAFTNLAATGETNEPVPTCFNTGINGSVWFSFVAPASGQVIITTDIAGATLIDTEIALYAATGVTCSDLTTLGTALACDQDGGTTINFNSVINQAGLTPGNTYYIQVDRWGTATNGDFGIEVQQVLSSDNFDKNSFVAYPNPVKDIFNVSYSSEISSVRVMNLLGQEVISTAVNATSTQIDMSQLSSGAYIVNVTVGDTIKTIKVVKQ